MSRCSPRLAPQRPASPAALVRIVLAMTTAAGVSGTAHAGDPPIIDWISTTSRPFLTPAAWSGGIVPGPSDIARFSLGTESSVTFNSADDVPHVRGLRFERSRTTFLAGQPTGMALRTIAPSPFQAGLLVAGTQDPTAIFRAPGWSLEASTVVVGQEGIGPGRMETIGDPFAQDPFAFLVNDQLNVGDGNRGIVRGNMRFDAQSIVVGRDAYGELSLEDTGTLDAAGPLQVGTTGVGRIGNVASIHAGRIDLGLTAFGNGSITSPTLTIAGNLDVGVLGVGEVNTTELIADGTVVLGMSADPAAPFLHGDGTLVLQGTGTIGGDLVIGLVGTGHLQLNEPVNVHVAGEVTTFGPLQGGANSMTIVLGPAVAEPLPIIQSDGRMDLPSPTIQLAPGVQPTEGDRWIIADAGMTVSFGQLSLPALNPGLIWRVENEPAGGDLQIVVVDPDTIVPADINDDGAVDFEDLLEVISGFGPCPLSGPCPADINFDDQVDITDLLQVLADWTG